MSFKEIIFFRIPQQFQFYVKGKTQKYYKANSKNISRNHNFLLPKYDILSLSKEIEESTDITIFRFFDQELDLSKSINWLKDYNSGKSSFNTYYAKYNKQNFEEVGDIKYVFEPSRFYFLPFLALHYLTNNNLQSKIIIEKILNDWSNQNPFLNSIHWTSGIEVGIRSINLIYTHMVLTSANMMSESIDKSIKELILYSYKFLKNHLSLFSSANNHLVAELAGLTTISSYFTNAEIDLEKDKWVNMLYKEILKQVNKDGVNMELCTHYHAEVTDHFFNSLKFIEANNGIVPIEIKNRIKKMFDFVNHVEYQGNKTIFGDNDEGYLLYPYFDKTFSLYDSLLLSSNIEFDTIYKTNKSIDLRNYLIYGENQKLNSFKMTTTNLKDTVFKTSGYAFFYDHKHRTKISFDFGKIGDKVSAAHGHSDIFHFNVDFNGAPVLVDSGTFQYHSRFSKWRTYFRSHTAHNTISINNSDHADQISRMSWLNMPITELLDCKLESDSAYIKAQTNAFNKYNINLSRELYLDKSRKTIQIKDIVTNTKTLKEDRVLYFYLNFNSNINIKHNLNTIEVNIQDKVISIENNFFHLGKLHKANDNSCLGWRSDKYNSKHKGQYFVFELALKSDQELITTILY